MIKINLASRKQALGAAAATEAKSSSVGGLKLPMGLSKITLDADTLKGLPLRKFLVPIVVAVAAGYYLDGLKDEELERVNAALAKMATEKTQLTAAAGKMRGYEATKKSMDSDEAAMRTKIDTIQKLIADRSNPPKVLRSLASSIPKDVWLSEFRAGEREVTFKGFSMDFNQISDFMKNLSESAYFTDLNIKNTQQTKDEAGLDVASFELAAKRR